MFSHEFCELFKNNYFVEDLRTAGFETPMRRSLFNKNSQETPEACNFIKKETLAQVLSFEFCKIFLVFPFYRTHLDVCFFGKRTLAQVFFCKFYEIFRMGFLQKTSQQPLLTRYFFSFLQISEVYSLKSIYLVE